MHISVSKIGTRLKTRRRSSTSSNGSTKSVKAQKPQRVYLKEPHDYFNIGYVLKMQERQRQLAKEGKRLPAHPSLSEDDDNDNDSNTSSNSSDSNKIVPSTKWRAYDLHNKPRSLYSEEDKKLAAAQKNLYQSPLAVPVHHHVPLKHVIVTKLKNYCNRLIGYKKQHAEMGNQKFNDFSTQNEDKTEVSSGRRGSSADKITLTLQQHTAPVDNEGKRKVHFSPETIFCERNEKSKFWMSFLEKKRERALRKAEEEEASRPRPFLPYLEAGLSYRSDEEFYELKNRFRSSSMSEGVQRSKPQTNWKNIANFFHKKPNPVEAVHGAGGRRKSLF